MATTSTDPYAWIVLRLPRKLWTKAQMTLEVLKDIFRWNVITGEMKFDNAKRSNKGLENSHVVQIVHHALDASTPEPDGYKVVFPFLLKGSTLPKGKKKQQQQQQQQLKRRRKEEEEARIKPRPQVVNNSKELVVATKPFVKDKFLWQVL